MVRTHRTVFLSVLAGFQISSKIDIFSRDLIGEGLRLPQCGSNDIQCRIVFRIRIRDLVENRGASPDA
jgi:hypothetical protein